MAGENRFGSSQGWDSNVFVTLDRGADSAALSPLKGVYIYFLPCGVDIVYNTYYVYALGGGKVKDGKARKSGKSGKEVGVCWRAVCPCSLLCGDVSDKVSFLLLLPCLSLSHSLGAGFVSAHFLIVVDFYGFSVEERHDWSAAASQRSGCQP